MVSDVPQEREKYTRVDMFRANSPGEAYVTKSMPIQMPNRVVAYEPTINEGCSISSCPKRESNFVHRLSCKSINHFTNVIMYTFAARIVWPLVIFVPFHSAPLGEFFFAWKVTRACSSKSSILVVITSKWRMRCLFSRAELRTTKRLNSQ
jgi:hypothetical protein